MEIGVDIVDINSVIKLRKHSERYLQKILLTENEFHQYEKIYSEKRKNEWLAGRIAAKEACYKALFSGYGISIRLNQIEVFNTKDNVPKVIILNSPHKRDICMNISISHNQLCAISVCTVKINDKMVFLKIKGKDIILTLLKNKARSEYDIKVIKTIFSYFYYRIHGMIHPLLGYFKKGIL